MSAFDRYAEEYDRWYDEHAAAYTSELRMIRGLVPKKGKGVEVGAGTGRFAGPLGIKTGVEPSRAMAALARKRKVKIYEARAEELPFADGSFDLVLMVAALCFVSSPKKALEEARRVLKAGGRIVIGMLDRNSPAGRRYLARSGKSRFYARARFYPVGRVLEWLEELGFGTIKIRQTLFRRPDRVTKIEPARAGRGKGMFVAVSAEKIQEEG